MKMRFAVLTTLLAVVAAIGVDAADKVTRNVVVTAEEEKVRDKAGYQAIAEIHREMDDDHSGSIDRQETTGFMMEDMQMRGSERQRRENAFHGDDDAITVDDLWEAWFESEERAWNNEKLIFWLTTVVNLPMYSERVQQLKIDGTILPRLAVHNSTFMAQQMGIKSSVHRQKLRLNALDVVLFGHRDNTSKTKDILLAFLALLLTSVLILYAKQRQRARQQVSELSTRLTQLKSMEFEFEDVQKKLNDERSKRSTSDGGVSQVEMENLRVQLEEAERRLEMNTAGGGTPLALQPLLRTTCENEMAVLEKQRRDCFKEMKEAIELVDRMQRKQSSVLQSLKLATGAASAHDQIDSKIFSLKSKMEKIHALTRETQERWMQIESLCGFPLLYLNEMLPMHRSPSQTHFYNPSTNSGASSLSSSASSGTTPRPKVSVSTVKQSAVTMPQASLSLDDDDFGAAKKTTAATAVIAFQPAGVSVTSDDSISMTSSVTTTNGSIEAKKSKGFMKLFKKSNSKGSLVSTNSSQ